MQESDLRQPVHQFFENKGYIVADEIRLFSRRIDVIARKHHDLIAIELKLQDWKNAIEQARLNLRVSDYSYVALHDPLGRFDPRLFIDVIQNGIGLLSINGVASEAVHPKRSAVIQRNLRRKFLAQLRSE